MKNLKIMLLLFICPCLFLLAGCEDDLPPGYNETKNKNQGTRIEIPYDAEAEREILEATALHTDDEGEIDSDIAYNIDSGEFLKEPEGNVEEIFKVGNDQAVLNGGSPAKITVNYPFYATEIWTYHYNNGHGAAAGTISMTDENGDVYGPWEADVNNNFYWVAKIDEQIPAGTYIIEDSDPSTWSQNGATHGQGMTWMNGIS